MTQKQIVHSVRRVRRRLVMQQFLHRFTVSLLGCVLLCIPLFVVDSLTSFDVPLILLWLCPLVAIILALAINLVRPVSLHDAAYRLDEVAGLKDRTVSALEFSDQANGEPLAELQLKDALAQLQRVQVSQVARYRFPRHTKFAVLAAVIAIVFAHIEFLGTPASSEQIDYSAEIAAETEPLREQFDQARKIAEETKDEELKEILQDAEKKILELKEGKLLPKEALARLTELSMMLQSRMAPAKMAKVDSLMRGLGEQFLTNQNLTDLGHALKIGEYQQAANKLDQKAQKLKKMDPEERQSVAGSLRQGGQSLQGTELAEFGSELASAGDSLEEGDLEGTETELSKIGRRLSDLDCAKCRSRLLAKLLGECEACKAGIGASCNGIGKSLAAAKSNNPSNSAGLGTDNTPFGEQTSLDSALQLERINGIQGEGPSSTKVTESPAEQAESAVNYRKVFARYQKLSEDALTQEQIPPGYRHYVKRYFEAIKPVGE